MLINRESMMITIRPSEQRGQAQFSWLDSKHTFSFGHYHDPAHMGFGPLRVINEDKVAPSGGFDMHRHHDMEIVSYVLDGALEHKDSIGNGEIIRPGDIQRMSAGTGVAHSEFNPSDAEGVHFLQIWFLPEKKGIAPSYAQRHVPADAKTGQLKLVMSRDGREDTLTLNEDIDMYAGLLEEVHVVTHVPRAGRLQWVQIARGSLNVNGIALKQGDGAAIRDETKLVFDKAQNAEIILFDMVA
jgi:redox-sensitive bicupin YhaK (pirin superfamily)